MTNEEIRGAARQINLLAGLIRIGEFAWLQHQDGLLDDRAWDGYVLL